MAEKIKKFFAKKKADAKFKLAGPGHRLTDSSTTIVGPSKKKEKFVPQRFEPTEAVKQAAEAAVARTSQRKDNAAFNTSLAAIQAKVRRELEAEAKGNEAAAAAPNPVLQEPVETSLEASPHLAVSGVYFKCSLISDEVLCKEDWRVRIKQFLLEQLEDERGLTACLMIHSCNYNRSKITECVNVLCRYLDNIIANPEEPKFHKIRCSNAMFTDKVLPIFGAVELLYAAGFRQQTLTHNEVEENFWVFTELNPEGLQTLEFLRESLKSEDRVELELDRNVQVLSPAQASKRIELPIEFYAISQEELKREQQLRNEVLEKNLQLRTKAMREKDELREIRKYKFALIRVRFPDGVFLQGTFSVYEKFAEVLDFVNENLNHTGLPFILCSPTGHKFEESDAESTLAELRLVPATILMFQWDPLVLADIQATNPTCYLKPEIMVLVKSL